MAYDLVTDTPESGGISSARLSRLEHHLATRYIDAGRKIAHLIFASPTM